MAVLVLDRSEERRLKGERSKSRVERFDEVWDGVYVISPVRTNEHQYLVSQIAFAFSPLYQRPMPPTIFAGCYVSDRRVTWKRNYRVPDVAMYLKGNPAQDRDSHWFGGPDFAVEIVSPHDRSRDKLEFYFKVGVRELLIVDRKPWKLELYRNDGSKLALVGACPSAKPKVLGSQVIPFRFSLASGQPRPKLLVIRSVDGYITRI